MVLSRNFNYVHHQECSTKTRLCRLLMDDVRTRRRLSWCQLHCQHKDVSPCWSPAETFCKRWMIIPVQFYLMNDYEWIVVLGGPFTSSFDNKDDFDQFYWWSACEGGEKLWILGLWCWNCKVYKSHCFSESNVIIDYSSTLRGKNFINFKINFSTFLKAKVQVKLSAFKL